MSVFGGGYNEKDNDFYHVRHLTLTHIHVHILTFTMCSAPSHCHTHAHAFSLLQCAPSHCHTHANTFSFLACAPSYSPTHGIYWDLFVLLGREAMPAWLWDSRNRMWITKLNMRHKIETGLRSESSGLVKGQVGTCLKIRPGSDILLLETAVRPSWKRTVSSIDICIIHFTINVWHTSTIGRTKPLNLNQIVVVPLIYNNYYHCAFQ